MLGDFATRRLLVERLREAHLDDLVRMDKDPLIMEPLGGVRSQADTRKYFHDNLRHWEAHGFGLWMLRLREDGRFVGRAYLRHLHIGGRDELAIGYALLPEFWGVGLATEIASAIVDLAHTRLGFSRLVAGVRPGNVASKRVLEKIGATYEKRATYKGVPHLLYRIDYSHSSSGEGGGGGSGTEAWS